MVMINTTIDEMNSILRKKLNRSDYEEMCFRYGVDLEGNGEYLNFEVTSDRIEIISPRSLAFLLGGLIGVRVHRNEGVTSKKMDVRVTKTSRRFVNVLLVKLDTSVGVRLSELMSMQDKFDKTVGRNRRAAAIGMFDYDKISFPLAYREAKKGDVKFVPLGHTTLKTYEEILSDTEQGRYYGGLLSGKPIVWAQKDGDIVALPPVINADKFSVTSSTKKLFVDITGDNRFAVNSMTKALIFNLQFLGEVSVIKAKYSEKAIDPMFVSRENRFHLDEDSVSRLLGIRLPLKKVSEILSRLDYRAELSGKDLLVTPPFYRQDVIHQVDVIDDILRYYGAENIPSSVPRAYGSGAAARGTEVINSMRDVLIGLGYQELDLNVLTNEKYQSSMSGITLGKYAQLTGIKSGEISMARSNLSPEMLRFVSHNLNKKFPQKLFDIGFVLEKTDVDVIFGNKLRLCILNCGQDANLSDVRVTLDAVFRGCISKDRLSVKEDDDMLGFNDTFIKGRAGAVYLGDAKIGVTGEVHPRVLNNFGIELPVSMAEIRLDGLI